jgi:hypothetical protein
VDRWRARFVGRRPDGLRDEDRPGRPPPILLDKVEEVDTATLTPPAGAGSAWQQARAECRVRVAGPLSFATPAKREVRGTGTDNPFGMIDDINRNGPAVGGGLAAGLFHRVRHFRLAPLAQAGDHPVDVGGRAVLA